MAQQVIDVGTSASDGTGDPLRDAFTKINDNFTELYETVDNQGLTYGNITSNVAGITFNVTRYTESYAATPVLKGSGQVVGNVYLIRGNVLGGSTPLNDVLLTVTTLANATVGNIATVSAAGVPIAPVLRVNGLTGNVTLTVNNIDGAASKAYINAAIAANIANVTGTVTDSLSANITAANSVISNHAARITTLESNAATQATAITNLTNTKATVAYVDTSIDLALSSNAILANVTAVNANVTAANAAILLRANLSGATFSGNLLAPNVTVSNLAVSQFAEFGTQGNPLVNTINFISNVPLAAGVSIQNINSSGSSALFLQGDDSFFPTPKFLALGVTGASYVDTVPPPGYVNDSFIFAIGGNLSIESNNDAIFFLTNNTERFILTKLGHIKLVNGTDIEFADGTIQSTAFGGNANISLINANVTAANAAITVLQSNASSQALELNNLIANAATQGNYINALLTNAATQVESINSLNANVGSYQTFANANAAIQSTSLSLLNANIIAANLNINSLTANATTQALELDNLQANAQAQQSNIIGLQSNAASQSLSIDLLNANLTVANINISSLTSNAATQSTQINLLNANLTAANIVITTLTSNASTQQIELDNLQNNVDFCLANIASTDANIAAANVRIVSIDANLGSVTTNVSILQGNISTLTETKANLISGNIQANYLIANANVKVGTAIEVGNASPINYPGLAGVFVGNANSYYQVVIQNFNNGSSASGDFVITADDGTDTNNYINIGINSSGFDGNFIVPAGDTGLREFAHDGYLNVIGGNAIVRTDSNVYLVANTAVVSLNKDGNFVLATSNLQFKNGSVQQEAITDVPGLYANIGALSLFQSNIVGNATYTPNNAANYNGTITNIQDALDELAARLRALNG